MTMRRRRNSAWEKCSSWRSTWRSQFGRYALLGEKSSPDSRITRAGNFPLGPEEISTRECRYDVTFKYRSNSLVRVCTTPDAFELQFHRKSFGEKARIPTT